MALTYWHCGDGLKTPTSQISCRSSWFRDIQGQMCPAVACRQQSCRWLRRCETHRLLAPWKSRWIGHGGWHVLWPSHCLDGWSLSLGNKHLSYIYIYTVYYCIAFYIIVAIIYQYMYSIVYHCISLYIFKKKTLVIKFHFLPMISPWNGWLNLIWISLKPEFFGSIPHDLTPQGQTRRGPRGCSMADYPGRFDM